MARDYAKKLEAMRAYAKTPAGKASKKKSQERYLQKRRDGRIVDTLKVNLAPLINALTHWR